MPNSKRIFIVKLAMSVLATGIDTPAGLARRSPNSIPAASTCTKMLRQPLYLVREMNTAHSSNGRHSWIPSHYHGSVLTARSPVKVYGHQSLSHSISIFRTLSTQSECITCVAATSMADSKASSRAFHPGRVLRRFEDFDQNDVPSKFSLLANWAVWNHRKR